MTLDPFILNLYQDHHTFRSGPTCVRFNTLSASGRRSASVDGTAHLSHVTCHSGCQRHGFNIFTCGGIRVLVMPKFQASRWARLTSEFVICIKCLYQYPRRSMTWRVDVEQHVLPGRHVVRRVVCATGFEWAAT